MENIQVAILTLETTKVGTANFFRLLTANLRISQVGLSAKR
jgi:hypothetical protein